MDFGSDVIVHNVKKQNLCSILYFSMLGMFQAVYYSDSIYFYHGKNLPLHFKLYNSIYMLCVHKLSMLEVSIFGCYVPEYTHCT